MRLPDLEGALTDLSDTLGPWTYALVAALAFLETGAFVGLSRRARPRSCSAASSPPRAASTSARSCSSPGARPRSATSRASRSAAASGGASSSRTARASASPPPRLERVEAFFDRHGGKAILIGRFIGIVRAVAPFLAGSSGMRLRTFLPWSLLGTALWATTFTLVGYAFHDSFASASHTLTHGALALAVVVAGVLAIRAHRQARAAR